ncbi:MAG: response regulator/pilus assembly protein [Chloroflexi bacterium]|nr:response regulator/pilus assembly protein [Chloroflexota bacterium]
MNQKKVLIIDDEFPVRYLVEHQLRRNGFEAISAKDGPSGIQAAHTHKPDLIVLDIMMPNMNGFEVCQEIRNAPSIASIPVIFLTACMTRKHKLRAFEIGADDYLVKPFQPDELLAHITAVLRRASEPLSDDSGDKSDSPGKIVSLFSPKGGVGTTTIAVQLSEAMVIREGRPVVLIDLDLPLGGIAPMLNLYSQRHIVDLLNYRPDEIALPLVKQYTQRHRNNLLVIPTPTNLINPGKMPSPASLEPALDTLKDAGYQIILDLGSTLSKITVEALRLSDLVYVITSGQPVANKLHNAFMDSASKLGLQPRQLLPVINELHGAVDKIELSRVPVARIPHANERTRTRMWLRDQGMGKLVSVML